jgi:hypothetical protein
MDPVHFMLPEDEIFLCGAVLLYGFLIGGVARVVAAWRKRRAV